MESIIRSLQYFNGTHELWNSYYKIIPKGTIVISKDEENDDYIVKLGNGDHVYKDLPEFLRISSFINLYNLRKFSLLSSGDTNRLLYYNGDVVESTSFTINELVALFNILSTQLTIKTCVTKPIITAKENVRYNTTFNLYAKSLSAYNYSGIKISQYIWELPDSTFIDGESIEYVIPNEVGLVGTTLTFKCKAVDQLGNMSDWSEFDVIVVNTSSNPVVISASVE